MARLWAEALSPKAWHKYVLYSTYLGSPEGFSNGWDAGL